MKPFHINVDGISYMITYPDDRQVMVLNEQGMEILTLSEVYPVDTVVEFIKNYQRAHSSGFDEGYDLGYDKSK